MAPSDYQSTGGSLKLKGATNSGVKKKKHKSKLKSLKPSAETSGALEKSSEAREAKDRHEGETPENDENEDGKRASRRVLGDDDDVGTEKRGDDDQRLPAQERHEESIYSGKTASEIRHERHKKQRLLERLKRDPDAFKKTHKEKVEELNRYLSGLSEHHDMPKIGPG